MPALPELRELERIIKLGHPQLEVDVMCEVDVKHKRFPVYKLALGNPDPNLPAIGFFGGIHGLERIGTQVLLSFLRGLMSRLSWDKSLQHMLQEVRLVFMPLINPGGMWQTTRSNPNGVDLMRNAPVQATEKVPFLLGGHRISKHLPWYRGPEGSGMEVENIALCRTVRDELLSRQFSIAIDCHSGLDCVTVSGFPMHIACTQSRIWQISSHWKSYSSRPIPIITTCLNHRVCNIRRMVMSGTTCTYRHRKHLKRRFYH